MSIPAQSPEGQESYKEACANASAGYVGSVKSWQSVATVLAVVFNGVALRGQAPEPSLPRPGAVLVTQVMGEVTAGVGEERKRAMPDERLRVGSTLFTGRRSLATLTLSNGATLQVGPESELEIEEFGQAPVSGSPKVAEMKEEPTISRTRLRLGRGEMSAEVKPLKTSRGSSFTLAMAAGTLRIADGTFRTTVQMSDLGLGIATLELQRGTAEFEVTGSNFQPLPVGKKLLFALETDKATGAIKVGEMPKESDGKAATAPARPTQASQQAGAAPAAAPAK